MARGDKEAQRQVAARERQRKRQIETFLARLETIFATSLRELTDRLRAVDPASREATRRAVEAAGVVNQLESILEANGYGDAFRQQLGIYQDELSAIDDEFRALGVRPKFASADQDVFLELVTFDAERLSSTLSQLNIDVKGVLYRSYILGETPDITNILDTFGERAFQHARTELNTNMATFSRTVTARKTIEADFDLVIYLGPEDEVIRDFCEQILSKDPPIYRVDDVMGMTNDNDLDAFTTGGGYNCRHQWRPISNELAKEMGYRA
jgi:hypothetical protein